MPIGIGGFYYQVGVDETVNFSRQNVGSIGIFGHTFQVIVGQGTNPAQPHTAGDGIDPAASFVAGVRAPKLAHITPYLSNVAPQLPVGTTLFLYKTVEPVVDTALLVVELALFVVELMLFLDESVKPGIVGTLLVVELMLFLDESVKPGIVVTLLVVELALFLVDTALLVVELALFLVDTALFVVELALFLVNTTLFVVELALLVVELALLGCEAGE